MPNIPQPTPTAPLPKRSLIEFASPLAKLLPEAESGPSIFKRLIPEPEELLAQYVDTIDALLYPESCFPRRFEQRKILCLLDEFDGLAYTTNKDTHAIIRLDHEYVKHVHDSKNGDVQAVRDEICGVLLHEHVHALQHDAPKSNDDTKGGLIEGIADYCRLQAGLGAGHWNEQEAGDHWHSGYEKTAFFLRWIAQTHDELLVPRLNRALQHQYTQDIFEELTGRKVDQLWKEYRAQLGGKEGTAPPAVPTHGSSKRDRLREKLGGSKGIAEEAAAI